MKSSACIEGLDVTVKGNSYGYFRVSELLPKISGKPRLVKVLHSSDGNFDFALIKTFKLSDLKIVEI